MSFIRTGLREIGLKIRRQKTRMALRHEKRVLQKSEINLGREGCSQAVNFPEVRNEIVALKKLEQEQKEVALRIAQIEESLRKIELQRAQNAKEQNEALAKFEEEKKPILERRNDAKTATDLCDRELAGVERRLQDNDAADRELLKKAGRIAGTGSAAGRSRRANGCDQRPPCPSPGRTHGSLTRPSRKCGSVPNSPGETGTTRGRTCRRGQEHRAGAG